MSFQETEFGSDTDDDDYVPTGDGHDASEEENSGDDEGAFDGSKKGKKKSLKSKNNPAKRGGLFDDGESKASREKEFEAEKKEIEEEKEKKKTDDLWAGMEQYYYTSNAHVQIFISSGSSNSKL